MGGNAEKIFRLVVCEALTEDAPGIDYNAGMIAVTTYHPPPTWRSVAASGALPPALAARFTAGEVAALSVIAMEIN
jgi:hypothetical protein